MLFKDIPEYYEVTYHNYSYVLSKYSFIPNDTEIYFVWFPIHQWDINKATKKTPIIGSTIIDAYSIPNTKVIEYIKDREQLFIESQCYGLKVIRPGIVTQDGEYVSLISKNKNEKESKSILYLLDAHAVNIWKNPQNFEQFFEIYLKE